MKKAFISNLLVCFLGWMLPLAAAAPITHLYLAHQWQENFCLFQGEDLGAFLLGNLFPDIRYLGEVSRERTHETHVTLEKILLSQSPFLAGMRLHALVDEQREVLVVKWNVYEEIKEEEAVYQATLLKLIEDEILYHQVNVKFIKTQLENVLEEELAKGSSYASVQQWHKFLYHYLSLPPSQLLIHLAAQDKGFFNIPAETIKRWSQRLPYLSQKPELVSYVSDLSAFFSESFQAYISSQRSNQ